MIKKIPLFLLTLAAFLSACGPAPLPPETATASATPAPSATADTDPCSPRNLPEAMRTIHAHMREFDDYTQIASNIPKEQILQFIPEMQRILREAEDPPAPACLKGLQDVQTAHMRTVISTLLLFINASDKAAMEQVGFGIQQARELHMLYDAERARLQGFTLTPAPTPTFTPDPNATKTPAPTFTPAATVTLISGAFGLVTNKSQDKINLRLLPGFNGTVVSVLGGGASVYAYGRTKDNQWILTDIPGKPQERAWVYAELVILSVPLERLPVVQP